MHCASTTPSANARCKSSANSINILFFPVYSLISTAQSSLFSFLWFFECVAKKKKIIIIIIIKKKTGDERNQNGVRELASKF